MEPKADNWLVFNGNSEKAWNDHASAWLSNIFGKSVSVRLRLPSEEMARDCWMNNLTLQEGVSDVEDAGRRCGIDILDDGGNLLLKLKMPLPFDNVFVESSEKSGHAQALVWQSWLGEKPGVRLVYPAGRARREVEHKVELRIGFPDGSYAKVCAAEKDRRLNWPKDVKRPWDEKKQSSKDVERFREFFARLRKDMPLGPLWGDAQKSIPDWLRPAFENEGTDVYELVCVHAESLPPPDDHDDLEHRVLVSFPRWLEFRLCKKLYEQSKDGKLFVKGKEAIAKIEEAVGKSIVPLKALRNKGLLAIVRPNNALELMANIFGVKRYLISRDSALCVPLDFRQNHPSFRGRLCPIETPESEMIGISLQLARGARVAADGRIVPAEGADRESGAAAGCIGWGVSLIPFAEHNDDVRNMLGAKNLRQATPVDGRCAPLVKTGAESVLAEKTARLRNIGICPNCLDENGELALGRDLLVAYMPWYGWNVDDAMVVSSDAAEKMAIWERKCFSREIGPEWTPTECRLDCCTPLRQDDVIMAFEDGGAKGKSPKSFSIRYEDPDEARLCSVPSMSEFKDGDKSQCVALRVAYEIAKKVPLGLGDKLMGRHGNKGVVGRVLDKKEMPHLPDDPNLPEGLRGRAVDILINPHGVLSRMNPGQLLETHLGWLLHSGVEKNRLFKDGDMSMEPGCVDNDRLDHDGIRNALAETGLNRQGCVRLFLPDGSQTERPVLVGFEHIVRLHHVPQFKAQARRGGSNANYESATQQATHGRQIGGGQRLGEMEAWALAAYDVPHVLEEMLGAKSDAQWAKDWNGEGCPPTKELFSGFPGVLRDWLFALCIGMDQPEKGKVRFSILPPESIMSGIGDKARRVDSDGGFSVGRTASFTCKQEQGCRNPLVGRFRISGDKSLHISEVFRSWGYDCSVPIRPLPESGDESDGKIYEWTPRPADGETASCSFVVTFKDYKPNKEWLHAEIVPRQGMCPIAWPAGVEKMTCCGRFDIHKDEAIRFGERAGKENESGKVKLKLGKLKAHELLTLLCEAKSGRSLGDFAVTCAYHSKTSLVPQRPYAYELKTDKGSVFDTAIFGDWVCADHTQDDDKWGYIELPVAVDYPAGAFVGSPVEVAGSPKLCIIPVLPMRYRRPFDREREGLPANRKKWDINDSYRDLVRACRSSNERRIGQAVEVLFKQIAECLDKKTGILRHDGLGRRVDRSCRLVITPNPDLEWNDVGVPVDVLWELIGDRILPDQSVCGEPVQRVGWSWKRSLTTISDDEKYSELCKYLQVHRPVILLNRQPTLHRDGFQAFYPVPIKNANGETLQISPLCCKGFAADFDGDEMVGHYPVSDSAQKEAHKMLPCNNLRQVGSGQPAAQYDRDVVMGLQIVYENQAAYAKEIDAINLDAEIRCLFDRKYKPGGFGKDVIDKLCKLGAENESRRMDVCQAIAALSRLAYCACTHKGVSFGFYDLLDLGSMLCGKTSNEEVVKEIELLRERSCSECVVSSGVSSVLDMVVTGANGKKQIHQIVGSRGALHVDWDSLGYSDARIPDGARSFSCSLSGGMSWDEMFWSSLNARTSMCNKKLGAGKAGDLTRRLVFMLWPMGVKGLVAAQAFGERGLQVAMQGFHTGGRGIDIARSRTLFLEGLMTELGENGSEEVHNFVKDDDYEGFKKAVTCDGEGYETEYANINEEHIRTLWEGLKAKASATGKDEDGFTELLFQRQKRQLFNFAQRGCAVSLDTPFAKVMFDLWGEREQLTEEVEDEH